jgi:hypothetical protein
VGGDVGVACIAHLPACSREQRIDFPAGIRFEFAFLRAQLNRSVSSLVLRQPAGRCFYLRMVGRVGFEPSTIGLKGQKGDFSALYFNNLPWRPLHAVHHNA